MNKTISIFAGLFSLLLIFAVFSNVVGREIAAQPAVAYDDGPALSGSFQTQQDEPNEQAKNNRGDESDPPIASADDQTDPNAPQRGPAKDSPDDRVKNNVEGPVEERTDVKPVEEQNQGTIETKPATPAEIPSGDKPAADASSQSEQSPAVVPPKPKRELSPALAALRDKTRRTLAAYQKMPFNSRQNTPDEIINCCLALGCDAEITLLTAEGERRANGIMCLCWNYPCAGYRPLTIIDGHVSARLGYGVQSRPSQLLAALALARVPASYPMRVGDSMRSVADLVESEKLSCRSGTDMSLKLVGLAYYTDAATWKNDLDQEWSLEKIIKEELTQPTLAPGGAGIDCLLGLSYALSRHEKRNLPVEGQFARAKRYLSEFQNYAFGIQNSNGGWGYYLSGKGVNRDDEAGLRSAGYVLQWLTLSLPEDRLDDPALATGMTYLINALNSQRYLNNLPMLSTREITGAMHALHALAIYDERLFKPSDSVQTPEEKTPPANTAKRESNAGQSR
jgi:hypothetical protein